MFSLTVSTVSALDQQFPKIYYINLNRSLERNNHMVSELSKLSLNYQRVEAIDGRHNLSHLYEGDPQNTKSEIACTISHFKAIETFLNDASNQDEMAIIAEDDLSLEFVDKWKKSLSGYIEDLTAVDPDWEIFQLAVF